MTAGDGGYRFGLGHVVGLLQAEALTHGKPATVDCDRCRQVLAIVRAWRRQCTPGLTEAVIVRMDAIDALIATVEGAK